MLYIYVVVNTQVTPELKACIHKLIGAFGINLEQTAPAATSTGTAGQPTYEALAKRAAAEDPAFQRLKNQFASDFDFKLVHNLHTWLHVENICTIVVLLVL